MILPGDKMTVARKKTMLTSAAAAVAAVAVTVLAAGFSSSVDVTSSKTEEIRVLLSQPAGSSEGSENPKQPAQKWREELATLCHAELQLPLFEVPESAVFASPASEEITATAAVTGSSGGLSVRLTGTILEPGHSMAVLLQPTGTVQLVGRGEHFEDGGLVVTVVEVEQWKVTVRRSGEMIELYLPQPKEAGMP